ncbi:retropepsin-like aspartic protease [Winogradskyella bathintestinalis]|uniref:Retropepsin-like aspartic protease n=1 Tax=Winogradskyella bathintestinalis TaxID=3035208 RepID=A0ABT7ZYV0_9FLAO|nr:retropepsin-like aspartic protease [Winogradskyella bathintestinalis]MDN3494162.1 retropepsin-like aspartic protease [Winogradskyella bathintestinalis]
MTKLKTYILFIFISLFSINSNAQAEKMLEWATQGTVENESYNSEIPFRYVDGYIFVDIIQNNNTYNFLFDTGAEATVIDKSIIGEFGYKPFSKSSVSGPIIKDGDINTVLLSSISIADVEFKNIGAVSIDFGFAKKKFCEKLDGIIGTTLLKKAKWQIDYKNKIIRLSNDIENLISEKPKYTLTTTLPEKGWGTETIKLNIDGYISEFNFDTGNGREKMVLRATSLKNFIGNNKHTIIQYRFSKSALDYRFIAKNVTIGDIQLENQNISLQREVKNLQLLGNRFFENYIITIDWEKHQLFLAPTEDSVSDLLIDFELNFKPNFETNKVEVATGLRTFIKKNKIKQGAILLKVNGKDISNFSHQELCDFWNTEWPKITDAEKLNIVISQKGKPKEIVITKKKLT